uniref:PPM-type phosphatase domain-containing protein n=1 Tax=Chromera velia CCMP2878 TaxID=1169474 RepID=A0A0G4IDK9_9ALVE|eukprot:Cvel_2348.t1-p1 / transcript=Cvel_2348.t1 / gene=Cvel_2348 / organism=Chromera_velia_CCMP2878 / gene_product=Protein phosphatase 2C homolog 1, putative / transcript_product=Protein phosphatase 2C homolog 1, putative / location=Cvel_scaffold91:23087-27413(-) / protein_length=627 / sequence_SO=supercontig / SO=protein_coding / is_pseudo=false
MNRARSPIFAGLGGQLTGPNQHAAAGQRKGSQGISTPSTSTQPSSSFGDDWKDRRRLPPAGSPSTSTRIPATYGGAAGLGGQQVHSRSGSRTGSGTPLPSASYPGGLVNMGLPESITAFSSSTPAGRGYRGSAPGSAGVGVVGGGASNLRVAGRAQGHEAFGGVNVPVKAHRSASDPQDDILSFERPSPLNLGSAGNSRQQFVSRPAGGSVHDSGGVAAALNHIGASPAHSPMFGARGLADGGAGGRLSGGTPVRHGAAASPYASAIGSAVGGGGAAGSGFRSASPSPSPISSSVGLQSLRLGGQDFYSMALVNDWDSDCSPVRDPSSLKASARGLKSARLYAVCEEMNGSARACMEDAHVVVDDFGGESGQGYFAVFDGHGGSQASNYCAAKLHEVFLTELQRTRKDPKGALERSFAKVDDQLRVTGCWNCGTTATVGLLRREVAASSAMGSQSPPGGPRGASEALGGASSSSSSSVLYMANVGDSRAVVVKSNGEALRLSYDHKAADPAERERVIRAGGVVMRNRVAGQLAIARALGDHALKSDSGDRGLSNVPTIARRDVGVNKDRCLIMASDGVWDVLSDQQAADVVTPLLRTSEGPLIAQKLVAAALARGSRDNIVALVIVF